MSASYHSGPVITRAYTGSSDFRVGDRVKYDATDGLALAVDEDVQDLGVVDRAHDATAGIGTGGNDVSIRLLSGAEIVWMRAAAAIAEGATVFKAAAGEVDDGAGTRVVGTAMASAAGADELVPVLPAHGAVWA